MHAELLGCCLVHSKLSEKVVLVCQVALILLNGTSRKESEDIEMKWPETVGGVELLVQVWVTAVLATENLYFKMTKNVKRRKC